MTSSYLYGEDVEVPEIPAEIIVRRVEILNDTLTELLAVHYIDRDTERVYKVLKEIELWQTINDTD